MINDVSFSLVKGSSNDAVFRDALDLRESCSNGSSVLRDSFDQTADIYVCYVTGKPIATMRVNQARRGPIECEEFYPKDLMQINRDVVGSASRFVKHAGGKADLYLMRNFVTEVWKDQFLDGMRVDVINVHERMINYYLRFGYQVVPYSRFKHPRLSTPSIVMVLFANSNSQSSIGNAFKQNST